MIFENYRILYLNLILCFLLIFNQIYLFIIIFFIKIPYILNFESELEYEFDFNYSKYFIFSARFLELDIDDEFYYCYYFQELYMLLNCRFEFDLYGGDFTLDYADFLDIIIYNNINDSRNYKHIYNNINYYNQHFNLLDFINVKNKYKYIKNHNNIKDLKENQNIKITNLMSNNQLYKNYIKIKNKIYD